MPLSYVTARTGPRALSEDSRPPGARSLIGHGLRAAAHLTLGRAASLATMLLSAVVLIAAAPADGAAQGSPAGERTLCDLVQMADIAVLLGRPVEGRINPVNGDCTWGAVGIARRGLTMSISQRDTATATDGYTRGRELASNNQTINDERGIGDRAYSAVVPYGATVTVLTGGRIVQFRYSNGVAGSPADLDRLRSIAAQVVGRLGTDGGASARGTAPPQ